MRDDGPSAEGRRRPSAEAVADRSAVTYGSPFGDGWVAFAGDEIVELGLPGTPSRYPPAEDVPEAAASLAVSLETYWNGGPLPPPSTEMLRTAARTELTDQIYRRVARIPAGETMTYAEVAASVGHPRAARAVGAAMAANRFAPVIPCHRVVGSDGSLRGYAAGMAVKRHLLDMEAGSSNG